MLLLGAGTTLLEQWVSHLLSPHGNDSELGTTLSCFPHPFLLSLYFPPPHHVYFSHAQHYTNHVRLLAPAPTLAHIYPLGSRAAASPEPEIPRGQFQGSGHLHVLRWTAWGDGTWAVRTPCTQGETAELPAATVGHCPPTQDRCPSVSMLLSCHLLPLPTPLSQKHHICAPAQGAPQTLTGFSQPCCM